MNIKINFLLLYFIIQWISVYSKPFYYLYKGNVFTGFGSRVCGISKWNRANSNVLCRELGYRDTRYYINEALSGQITHYTKDQVWCDGNEYAIYDCAYTLPDWCSYVYNVLCRTEGCQSYIFEKHTSLEPVIFYEGEKWFFLCSTSLTMNEADVICRENEYSNGAESIGSIPKSVLYGDYPTYQYNISCDGDESSLCDCHRTEIVCSDDVATVKCFPPDSGTILFSIYKDNVLEIYLDNVWNLIISNWNGRNSLLACKQLGYPKANYYTYTNGSGYLLPKFYTNYTNIDCVVNEDHLADCDITFGSIILVDNQLSSQSFVVQYCTRGDCEVHVPSITDLYQIVEYFVDGQSYYICADYFTNENADIVCREISLTFSISFRNVSVDDLPQYASIYPLRHNCFGNESSLCNCSVSDEICLTSSVVEVQCDEPEIGTIRVSSIGDYLEVYLDGWKYVCGDGFSNSNADVGCRRLGFKTYETWSIHSSEFNQTLQLQRNLQCNGDEVSILLCPYNSTSSCTQNVRLYCESGSCGSFVSNGDVKPVPVRFYDGQANYYLCFTGFTSETANVICREGDYGRVKSISNVSQSSELNYLISANAYSCVGDEKSLCDCFSSPIVCEDEMIAVVQCEEPEFGQSRIQRGELQIYQDGIWTNVCYENWNPSDCDVTCRQFGYGAKSQGCIFSSKNVSNGKWISNISCHGNETRLVECDYEITSYCMVDYQQSLRLYCKAGGCRSYVTDYSPQIVRYYDLAWYQLIADSFTLANADVVCRENFETTAVNFTPIQSPNLTILPPILQRTFACVGNENSLCDCPSSVYSGLSDTVIEVECLLLVSPFITTPSENITMYLLYINAIDEMYECSAGGTPTPDVYWTTDFIGKVGNSSTLHLIVSEEPTLYDYNHVYYCVAENMEGRAIISVTFYFIVPNVKHVQKELDRIEMELLRTESISQTTAVETVTNIQAYLDALNETSKNYEFDTLLTTATSIIERIVRSTEGIFNEETTLLIANLFDTIIHHSEGYYSHFLKEDVISTISVAFSTAIYTVEYFSHRLCEELLADNENNERSENNIETDYISIIVQVIELEDIENTGASDISLPLDTGVDYTISMSIPLESASELSSDGKRLAIANSIIKRNQDIKIHESESEMFVQASDILIISIAGLPGGFYLSDEVTLAFETSSGSGFSAICVYLYGTEWLISNSITTIEESHGLTTCKSKYYTRLAVFVTRYDYVFPTKTFLSVMSYIIVSISVICLIISLILFCIAGKAFFKVEANYIYFNYCIALLLATSSFLFVIESGTFVTTFCQIIAFTLQMTWLAVFTWTVCIGIFILFKLRLIVTSIPKFYSCLTIFGWGFTVLIPIITASVSRIGYVDATEHCYMKHKYVQVFSFIVPIILLLSIHILLLIIAIIKIIINKWKDRITPHQATIKHMFISTLILTPALGLPIVFLMLHSFYNYEYLLFVFIISTGLIGLIFLLVVVLRVKEVQAIFKKKPEPEVVEVNNLPEPEVVEVNNLDGQAPPLYEDVIEISHTNDAYINPMYGMN